MWNLSFRPPEIIEARVLTRLPDAFREPRRTDWVDANKPGHVIDSFLEGPVFDRAGNLYVTDIPVRPHLPHHAGARLATGRAVRRLAQRHGDPCATAASGSPTTGAAS